LTLQSPGDQQPENNQRIFPIKIGFWPGCVRLTEIMFQPGEEGTEWVELYNASAAAINLQNWQIADVRPSAATPLTTQEKWLAAENFLVIAADSNILQKFPHLTDRLLIPLHTFPTLNNTSDAVTLYDLTRQAIDSVFYQASWGNQPGVALERIDLNGHSQEPTNWILSDDPRGGTPGEINSIWPHEHDLTVMPNSIKFKPARVRAPATVTILAHIKNAGRTPADSFQVDFYWDKNQNSQLDSAEEIGTAPPELNLRVGDVREVKIQWEVHTPGRYQIGVQVRSPSDEKSNNNQAQREILIGAPSQSLIINEFLYNPASGQAEWIEFYNPTTGFVSLNGWRVYDSNLATALVLADSDFVIPPFDFGVLANDSAFFLQYPWVNCPALIARNLPTLNNDRDAMVLRDLADLTQDSLFYFANWGNRTGVSLERRYWRAESVNPEAWQLSRSQYGATPGGVNSCDLKSVDLELLADSIRFEPLTPHFSDSIQIHFTVLNAGKNEVTEFSISCLNQAAGDTNVPAPVLVHHFSGALTPLQARPYSLTLPPSPSGHRQLTVQIDAPADVDLSNNRVSFPISVGFAPGQVGINEIMYSPLAGQVEWIEIYNRSDQLVDIGAWQIADGTGENPIPLKPSLSYLPPQGFAVLTGDSAFFETWPNVQAPVLFTTRSFPSLNNTTETVWLFDQNGNLMDQVTYADSWGGGLGIALERINPNLPSNEATNWNSCVAPPGGTPGAVNSIFVIARATQTEFSVTPNPFSPDNDGFEDFTLIAFDLPLFTARINLKLYDVRGRLIRTLLNAESSVARRSVIWDGRDDDQQLARVGIYIIFLEALNETQGVVLRAKHTVVLARQLSN
ncbi:lamin tail domain-containing protein, partial [candidate division KSB1 bacterium]|nr:lamin tail domain-containing protein [candidate division KSB1 bacterium]